MVGKTTKERGEERKERVYMGRGKQGNKGFEEEEGKKETWEEEKTKGR